MIFLVHAAENDHSIAGNLGTADYSYFFVMKKFLPVLRTLGRVIVVERLARVDDYYFVLRKLGFDVVLLAFTPPQKTPLGLRCPTFPVFAWEYSTIPDESWSDEPRHNWAWVLKSLPGAITHSRFTVDAVHRALGAGYPVVSLPSPLWNDFSPLYLPAATASRPLWRLELARGVVLDSHALGMAADQTPAEPAFEEGPCGVTLGGIVYTAVFNPNDGRKNWHDLLSGFCFTFRENPDATLLLKLAYHDAKHACGMVWKEMKKLAPYRCRVVLVQGFLDARAYRHMVGNSTYVVNAAHGEGQCLPLMEFMSAGKPAIAPGHTAMADYITTENAFVVRSSEEWTHWPHDPRLVLRTFRYRIDWQSLCQAYRESFDLARNEPEKYRMLSGNAHDTLREHCSREKIAVRLAGFMRDNGYPLLRWQPLRRMLSSCRLLARRLTGAG